eukprot:Nitzschia sp. Nitz4//scaffold280_size24494//2759//3955//NITZ4_008388-RA/size24494-processed-gene-0.15-mRNA-1//1//CDS//3329545579//7743//frame0
MARKDALVVYLLWSIASRLLGSWTGLWSSGNNDAFATGSTRHSSFPWAVASAWMLAPATSPLFTTSLALSSSISSVSAKTPEMPKSSTARSTPKCLTSNNIQRHPPWNPSSQIDVNGFLSSSYRCIPGDWESSPSSPLAFLRRHRRPFVLTNQTMATVRQVPGDGSCLFHAVAVGYAYHSHPKRTHLDLCNSTQLNWLYEQSNKFRQMAVDCLEKKLVINPSKKRSNLFVQGRETIPAEELVQAAASMYGVSSQTYCDNMRQDAYWGGGPEVVALCNALQRPIHIYELISQNNQFVLRRMACFGSPRFDRKSTLHVLSADARFPDLTPGSQREATHFLAVFPEDGDDASTQMKAPTTTTKRSQGGSWWSRFVPSRWMGQRVRVGVHPNNSTNITPNET